MTGVILVRLFGFRYFFDIHHSSFVILTRFQFYPARD